MYIVVKGRPFITRRKKKRGSYPAPSCGLPLGTARGEALLPLHPFLQGGGVVAHRAAHLDVGRPAALEPLLGEPGGGQVQLGRGLLRRQDELIVGRRRRRRCRLAH
jgi:hypothetical protein